MKSTLTLVFSILLFITNGFGQNQYSTINNRVIISTLVNGDTILVENTSNEVRLNGQIDLLSVIYHNTQSRLVSSANGNIVSNERSDMIIEFSGDYPWLDEQLKTTQPFGRFTDEMTVRIESTEQYIPVDIEVSRVQAGLGFTVILKISGSFSGEDLEDDFPNLKFDSDLNFNIALTVRVTE